MISLDIQQPRGLSDIEFWMLVNDLKGTNMSLKEEGLLTSLDNPFFTSHNSLFLLHILEEVPSSLGFTAGIINKLYPAIMNASQHDNSYLLRAQKLLIGASQRELEDNNRRRPKFKGEARRRWSQRSEELELITTSLRLSAQ